MNLEPCELWFRPASGGRWKKLLSGTYSECVDRIVQGGDDKFPVYWLKELKNHAAEGSADPQYAGDLFTDLDL